MNKGFTKLNSSKNGIVLFKENKLLYNEFGSEDYNPITLPELLIKQFFVTNETLYIYDGETLHQYQLLNN